MPQGLALTIGLNSVDPAHYGGWSGELTACEADAEDMAEIATLDTKTSSFFDHRNPEMVKWLGNRKLEV